MPEIDNQIKIDSTNIKCKNCGSNLRFDPTSQDLVCPNCSSHFAFDKNKTQIKHEIEEGKSNDKTVSHDKWAKEMKVVKCKTCGAEIMLSGLEISQCCPYCGSDYVAEEEVLPGLKPDTVIPFAFNEDQAGDKFALGMKKKFLAPRALKKKLSFDKIRGIYVPTFTFDANSETDYEGRLGRRESHTDSKGRTVTTIKYFHIKGHQSCIHSDFVEETSSKITGKQMNALLPYDFSNSYEYNPNYVRGYPMEHYENRLVDCYANAKEGMKEGIKRLILKQYQYDKVDYLNMKVTFSNELYSYRMLPIYFLEFYFKKKKYMVLMNGQTGKVGEGYPKSALKIAGIAAIVVLIAIAIILLIIFVPPTE